MYIFYIYTHTSETRWRLRGAMSSKISGTSLLVLLVISGSQFTCFASLYWRLRGAMCSKIPGTTLLRLLAITTNLWY